LLRARRAQWRYAAMADKMSTAMLIAERVYALTSEQNDAALTIGAYRALSRTLLLLGDFESARHYASRGVQIWRSGGVQSYAEDPDTPVVACLCYKAFCEWHLGEIKSSQANLDEGISLAKELKDMYGLALALSWAAIFAQLEHNPSEVERLASDLIELSTRHHFLYWLAVGAIHRGWARSAFGDTAEGILQIEHGIRDFRASGTVTGLPFWLAVKAEALHLGDRTLEALEAINDAEAVAERFEQSYWFAELRRLRGVLLAALGADETQIEASFCEAIRIAKGQKSVSLEKRAEATYTVYRRQKASASGGRGFRLPLW